MNIYNFTKGQLITAWIFVIIELIILAVSANTEEYIGEYIPLVIYYIPIVLFVLVAYTIGWRNNRKK